MAFSVYMNDGGKFPVIHLKDDVEKTEVVVYSFGALLNAFITTKTDGSKHNIIDGYISPADAEKNITNGFKSAKLSPFVCRIADGTYSFNQQQYRLNKFFLKNQAIHGLLYDALFSIKDSGEDNAAFVTLQYQYTNKNEGFPFAYNCSVTFRLENLNKLSITTTITNNSEDDIPVCDGWHPYFTLGASINNLSMQLNADKMIEFNEQLIPTGNVIPFDKFKTPQLLQESFFDNCFLINENSLSACVLKDVSNGLQLTIAADKSYPYLQIYTPENRKSIAIENLTAAPDAFNNKMGLIILKPAQQCSFRTSYQVKHL